MLRNNADARRCSYFELGLPVFKWDYTISTDYVSETPYASSGFARSEIMVDNVKADFGEASRLY